MPINEESGLLTHTTVSILLRYRYYFFNLIFTRPQFFIMATTSNFELLAVWFDEKFDDEEWDGVAVVECRFLVDSKFIKYVSIDDDVYPPGWAFTKHIKVNFPAFPTGDWNVGQISRNTDMGDAVPYFSSVRLETLPGINNAWHPLKIDYLNFTVVEVLERGSPSWTVSEKERVVRHPSFEKPVHMRLAQFPRDIEAFENETEVYRLIDGKGIAPKLLGHVTETGRVIGNLTEWDDNSRTLECWDKNDCLEVLDKLHACGILYCRLGYLDDDFSCNGDGKILMYNFETAKMIEDLSEKEKEEDLVNIERQFVWKADAEALVYSEH